MRYFIRVCHYPGRLKPGPKPSPLWVYAMGISTTTQDYGAYGISASKTTRGLLWSNRYEHSGLYFTSYYDEYYRYIETREDKYTFTDAEIADALDFMRRRGPSPHVLGGYRAFHLAEAVPDERFLSL